jgi:anti-anti-sigma factor
MVEISAALALAPVTWDLVVLKTRVDAGTFDDLEVSLRNLRLQGKIFVALDLKLTRFISVSAIQSIVTVARELKEQGGEMVLIGPMERTKRHFEIYGSLRDLRIVRDGEALGTLALYEPRLG